jgi:hypothetical protein
MIWSAGVSTTHNNVGSRSSSRQTSQICASVKVLHFSQCCRCSVANSNERPSFSAPSRSCCIRWYAMRCADFGPTPGSTRSASTSADKAEGCFMRIGGVEVGVAGDSTHAAATAAA